MSYVLAYAISATLTGGLLWAVARWTGFALPIPDLLVLLRATEAGVWPETVLMVAGSGVIWVIVFTTLMTLGSLRWSRASGRRSEGWPQVLTRRTRAVRRARQTLRRGRVAGFPCAS